MKLYLAALFGRREEMEGVAYRLKSEGYDLSSCRWVFGGEEGLSRAQIAIVDLEDVDRCDVLLSFTHERGTMTSGGGRHAEFGYALARGKECVLIGPREHLFHHHPAVKQYDTLDMFLSARPKSQDGVAA